MNTSLLSLIEKIDEIKKELDSLAEYTTSDSPLFHASDALYEAKRQINKQINPS
jgi:hypothetical protein